MPGDGEEARLKAEIPDDVIAEAVAAVEKHAHEHEKAGGVSTPAAAVGGDAGHAGGVSTAAADAPYDRRERFARDEELDKVRAALATEHDLRLRALADLDNFRKRVAREREMAQRFGAEDLLRDLLPALDNMDRALSALPEGPLATGVSMTRRQLEEALKRHGLTAFQVEPGTPFDPNVHDAVHTIATPDHPPGTVAAQQLRGYFLHDRLLRPAAVVVASAPDVAPGGTSDG